MPLRVTLHRHKVIKNHGIINFFPFILGIMWQKKRIFVAINQQLKLLNIYV